MDRVPVYLVWYLFRIHRHDGESGYLKRRLEIKDPARAVYEKSMLTEMRDLNLVALSDNEDEIVFNPLVQEVCPGVTIHTTGVEHRISVPRMFIVLARGHYVALEFVVPAIQWLLASALGAFIALAISG